MPDDLIRFTKHLPVLKKSLTVIVMMIADLHADTTHFSMAGAPKAQRTLRSVWCTCVRRQSSSRGTGRDNFNNNNNINNNINPGGRVLEFGLGPPPSLPKLEDLIKNGAPPPNPFPPGGGQNISFTNNLPIPPQKDFDVISGTKTICAT